MKYFVSNLLLIVIFFSCKKDNNDPEAIVPTPTPPAETVLDYSMTSHVGNYWVYDKYVKNYGDSFNYNGQDTAFVDSIVTINNALYFSTYNYFTWFNYNNIYVHDSLNFIVNEQGDHYFALLDPGDTLGYRPDTVINYLKVAYDSINSITVPAGSFSNLKVFKAITDIYYPFDSIYNPLISYEIYAKGIGKIYEEIWVFSTAGPPIMRKKELKSFSVQ